MTKPKLSPVKYETAFVPKINFQHTRTHTHTHTKKQASFGHSITSRIGATSDHIINISWNSFRLVAKNPMRSRSQFLFSLKFVLSCKYRLVYINLPIDIMSVSECHFR